MTGVQTCALPILDGKRPNKPTKDIKEFINYKLSALEYIVSLVKIEEDLPLKDLYLEES